MLAGTLQQHPLPRAPWTGPPRGAERGEGGGGALCAGPSRGKDTIQGARTVLSPSLTTWSLLGPRLGDAWGFKGLPGPPRAVPRGQAQ